MGSGQTDDDLWNFSPPPLLTLEDWNWVGKNDTNPSLPPLLVVRPGYNIEYGATQDNQDDLFLEDVTRYIHYYEKFFYGKEHVNFITIDNQTFPACITLEKSKVKDSKQPVRCLIHTKERTKSAMISGGNSKDRIRGLKNENEKMKELKFYKVVDEEIESYLLNAEQRLIPKNYKFGVLYIREGQHHEDEYFSNTMEEGDVLDEFLHILGDRIELSGWKGFRGGLDTRNNATGKTSVYTEYEGFPVMYHVSGLLPFSREDPQQIERKRHLGNDIVVIVFNEGNTPFDPTTITSHYNHAFLVVQVHQRNPTQYRLALICKDGVLPSRPHIRPEIIEDPTSPHFREFLLKKLINTERAAMYAPDFSHKDSRTRKTLLNDLGNNFSKSIEKKSALKFPRAHGCI